MENHSNKSSSGFTLVEILAAITILSIVLLIFIPFFTQFALFTSKSEENLDAINIAENVLHKAKEPLETELQNGGLQDLGFCSEVDSPEDSTEIKDTDLYPFLPEQGKVESNQTYYVKVFVCKSQMTGGLPSFVQLRVRVYKELPNGSRNAVTETFHYLKSEG